MSIIDSMTTNGWSFYSIEPVGTESQTYFYLDFSNNKYTQVQNPADTDYLPGSYRYSPSWYVAVGVASGTTGTVSLTLEGSDDRSTWTQIKNNDITWEYHQLNDGINKRIQAFGDSYVLPLLAGSQVRLYTTCMFSDYRLVITTSSDYVDSASLGVNVLTFFERYTGFDQLV